MSTIQEQLKAIGEKFTVDGMEWKVISDTSACAGILDASICNSFLSVTFYHDGDYGISCSGYLNIQHSIHTNTTTPESACREAIRLCRERVSELAGALGMVPNEADINTSAEIAANIESPMVQYLAERFYKKGARYVMNFNQHTSEKEGQA